MTASTMTNRQVVYTGRTTNWLMVGGSCLGAVLVALLSRADASSSGIVVPMVLLASGVLLNGLTASSVRVATGPNGVAIHWGVVAWPRWRYRLDQVVTCEVIDLPWWRVTYGLWWTPRRTSCTVRRGPSVRLTLESGRIVTLSVPDPSAAVAAVHTAQVKESAAAR